MPDDASTQAGKRFGSDLRARREERDLSIDELQEKAGVPQSVLESFESGGLAGQSMFNRVYLRSLVRTYAASTGIPSSAALSSLEAALSGEYEEGQIKRDIEEHERATEQREREAAEQEAAEQERAEAEAKQEARAAREAEAPAEASEGSAEEESTDAAAATGAAAAGAAGASAEEEEAWSAQSPPGASPEARRKSEERLRRREEQTAERDEARREGGRQRRDRSSRRDRDRRSRSRRSGSSAASWIVGALVVLALAVGAYFLFRPSGGPDSGEPQAAAAADTAAAQQQDQNQSQQQRPRANLQLGNTVNFTVVAQGGPVREIRITRDEDVRRPYWIEEGQAKVFPASQRIVLEREAQLDKIRLLVNGYPYPTDRRDAQGRIVITRQDLQAFADTLRGEPASLSVPTDTASKGGVP